MKGDRAGRLAVWSVVPVRRQAGTYECHCQMPQGQGTIPSVLIFCSARRTLLIAQAFFAAERTWWEQNVSRPLMISI